MLVLIYPTKQKQHYKITFEALYDQSQVRRRRMMKGVQTAAMQRSGWAC